MLTKLSANTLPPVTFGGTLKWVLVWSGGIVLCALGATAPIAFGVNPVVGGIIAGPLGIGGIICLYAIISLVGGHRHSSRLHRDFVRVERPKIQTALERGDVFVKKVSANAVITIVEFEDEGPGCIYDVGDGKILFLKGQRFFPVNDEMPWPNTDFEIVRTVDGDVWVGIFCSGSELIPILKLDNSVCVDDIVWEEREELLEGRIEAFAKKLTNAI